MKISEVPSACQPIPSQDAEASLLKPNATLSMEQAAQSSGQNVSFSTPTKATFTSERDSAGKLTGWGMPMEFFMTDQSQAPQTPCQPTLEPAVHPLSYPAIFGNTTGTAYVHKDGVSFTCFDQKTKLMQRYEVAPIHANMLRPLQPSQDFPSP